MYEKEINHLDLFSGVGGFALALDRVYGKTKHTFVEIDPFCQEILKKHWPEAEIHGDIHKFIADSKSRKSGKQTEQKGRKDTRRSDRIASNSKDTKQQLAMERKPNQKINSLEQTYILTGGFPCQPFSQAGRRKGTNDDRYLWPAMLECVSLFKPEWIIAENVGGLITWNNGMVFETVCSDLEKEGYEVQPFVIPACAVGAPHRRDRVWIVANCKDDGSRGRNHQERRDVGGGKMVEKKQRRDEARNQGQGRDREFVTDTRYQRPEKSKVQTMGSKQSYSWNQNWLEVASQLCRVDDGFPRRLDRNPRLKALGNAIVPQVAEMIMREIKHVDNSGDNCGQ